MIRPTNELSTHDQLVLIMAQYFKKLGYTDIKADIPGWLRPDSIFWTSKPETKYYPDLTCLDSKGVFVILEAETCSTLDDTHTQEQFKIFRAHATQKQGRFEVIVPRICGDTNARDTMKSIAQSWKIIIDNIWTPGS